MLFLSIKHLLSKKKQTSLILAGIVLGTTAYVAISGMMLGFQTYIIERLVNNEAHIRISAKEEMIEAAQVNETFYPNQKHVFWQIPPSGRRDSSQIENPKLWFDRFERNSEVFAYSPQYSTQVIFRRGSAEVTGKIIGSRPSQQIKVSNINEYIKDGMKLTDLGESGNRIILGESLLKRLGAQVSETVTLSTGSGQSRPFKVIGIFNTGIHSLDESTAFGTLVDVQTLQNASNRITDIGVRLLDVEKARSLAEGWRQFSSDKIQSWDEANDSILSVFKVQDITRNFMTISIVVVAAFGIYNILSIMVAQKRKEIAILRALGFDGKQIVELFLMQGLILGILGGLLGVIIGRLVCGYMSTIHITPGRMGSANNTMLVSFDILIYVKAFFISLFSSFLSSFLPSYAAGKLTPIEIIRSEG